MSHPTAWDLCHLSLDEWVDLRLELRIRLAAGAFLGWRFTTSNPRVPFSAPGYPDSIVDPESRATNCSTLTSAMIAACYPKAGFDMAAYSQMQVYAEHLPEHPDAPIECVERLDIGEAVVGWSWNHWHLVQGYRSLAPRWDGHALLCRPDATGVLVLDAGGTVGPRFMRRPSGYVDGYFTRGIYAAVLSNC